MAEEFIKFKINGVSELANGKSSHLMFSEPINVQGLLWRIDAVFSEYKGFDFNNPIINIIFKIPWFLFEMR